MSPRMSLAVGRSSSILEPPKETPVSGARNLSFVPIKRGLWCRLEGWY
jgi:hypothetical protein